MQHLQVIIHALGSSRDFGAALNPHFMLVNYTGAAVDLPGEIPRKKRTTRSRDMLLRPFRPLLGKLHIAPPGPPSVRFGKPAGRWRIATSGKTTFVIFWVLGGSVRGTRSPSLTSILPVTSHARVICGETGLCTKSTRKTNGPRD
jgi:hypothetical protein